MPNYEDLIKRKSVQTESGETISSQGIHMDPAQIEKILVNAASLKSNPNLKSASSSLEKNDKPVYTKGETVNHDGFDVDNEGYHLDRSKIVEALIGPLDHKISVASTEKGKQSTNIETNLNKNYNINEKIFNELTKLGSINDKEVEKICKAIRDVAKDAKAKKILLNTKKIAKNAEKFYQKDNGIKVVFSILQQKYAMNVDGDFTGKEAVYIQVNGNDLEGVVLEIEDDNFKDVTKNYKVSIKKES